MKDGFFEKLFFMRNYISTQCCVSFTNLFPTIFYFLKYNAKFENHDSFVNLPLDQITCLANHKNFKLEFESILSLFSK